MPGSAPESTYARLVPDGLLYLVLVVVWAFVLIPMWLRKHDEANENRSVDRFSRALSSLSGRRDRKAQSSGGGAFLRARAVVMPGRPRGAQSLQVTVTGASAPNAAKPPAPATAGDTVAQPPEPRRSPVAKAAQRRRRVLLGLLVVTILVLVAGLLHKVPTWAAAIPALLVVVFVVSARRARMRTELVQRRRLARESLTQAARAAQTGRSAGARRGVRASSKAPATQPAAELDLPVTSAPARVGTAVAGERGWSAVPTTLPTYVTAPAATRVPRVIDRNTPGSWSGAAMLEQARTTRQESREDSGMRVESFEIRVPRTAVDHPAAERPAEPAASAAGDTFAERYVDTSAGAAELDATDDESALSALLDDPRTGVAPQRRTYRRAAG
jgi:hypothetical protein